MTAALQKFTFLSSLIGLPVVEEGTGRRLGRVADIAASLKELYPKAAALVVRPGLLGPKAVVPWKDVRRLVEHEAFYVAGGPLEFSKEPRLPEGEFLVRETFWDKQVVDTSGSKVVRVNDLHLLREDLSIWVVHMDVGITGLMRRLDVDRLFVWLAELLFSYTPKDRFISWKFVQPVSPEAGAAVSLKVHHSKLAELLPADLAEILVDLGIDERISILKSLDAATAGKTFQELPMSVRVQMADLLDPALLRGIVAEMEMDEAVDLLSQVPNKTKKSVLSRMPKEWVGELNHLLDQSRLTAGSIMNTDFIAVRPESTAAAILDMIRAEAPHKESIYHTYVQDDHGLAGVITLRQLLTADPAVQASQLMRKRVVKTRLDTNIQEVAEIFKKYDFTVVPVVDKLNRVQGIITMKDAFEAAYSKALAGGGAS